VFLMDEGFFLFVIPALVFAMYAQARVSAAYAKASRLLARSRLTGAQLARRLLDELGLVGVTVQRVDHHLGDHYDPVRRAVRLSPAVHDRPSLAALGIAAHEVGHALQHHCGYAPLAVRQSFLPVARLGSGAAWPLFLVGLLMGADTGVLLMNLAIVLFGGAVLFHLVTLPVEYNASSRAMTVLLDRGYLGRDEVSTTREVLNAAALTYLAAAAAALANLARMLLLRQRRS